MRMVWEYLDKRKDGRSLSIGKWLNSHINVFTHCTIISIFRENIGKIMSKAYWRQPSHWTCPFPRDLRLKVRFTSDSTWCSGIGTLIVRLGSALDRVLDRSVKKARYGFQWWLGIET